MMKVKFKLLLALLAFLPLALQAAEYNKTVHEGVITSYSIHYTKLYD